AKEADGESTSINRLAIQILSADLERRQTISTAMEAVKTTAVESMKDGMGKMRAPEQMKVLHQQHSPSAMRMYKLAITTVFNRLETRPPHGFGPALFAVFTVLEKDTEEG